MAREWGFGDNGRKAKKRSKTAERLRRNKKRSDDFDEGFDVAPKGDDFDLADLVVKKQKPAASLLEVEENKALNQVKMDVPTSTSTSSSSSNNRGPDALSLADEKREAKILKIDVEKKEETTTVGRMEGESKKAFNKRMKNETKRIIRNEKHQDNRNPEKKQRKKDFMNQKKKKKKAGKHSTRVADDDDYDVDDFRNGDDDFGGLITGERVAQQVAFGEQAQRPPVFKILPRGATPKNKANIKRKPGMSAEQQHAEQRSMEQMRAKVQAQYALIKQQRKRDGDFHL